MLGRPFGAPNQPHLQRSVLRALLGLFERSSGPVLEDFTADALALENNDSESAFACPVSFASTLTDDTDVAAKMRREIAQLAPWYDIATKRRGRTSCGISGMSVEDAAAYAASYLSASPKRPRASDISAGVALKRACDDLKTYYYEAVAAQPGNLSATAITDWFWNETAAAKVFLAIQQVCLKSSDKSLEPLGKSSLVPRSILHTIVEPSGEKRE